MSRLGYSVGTIRSAGGSEIIEEKLGSVGKVGKLHLLSLSSIIDVSDAGLGFFVEENARSTDAVSSVCFFSDEPGWSDRPLFSRFPCRWDSPRGTSGLSGAPSLSLIADNDPDCVVGGGGMSGGEGASVLVKVASSEWLGLTAEGNDKYRRSDESEGRIEGCISCSDPPER